MFLATVLNPTSASARICRYNSLDQKDEVRMSIGTVFEEMSLDIQLSRRDNLDFHACMYHMPKKVRGEVLPRQDAMADVS